MQELDSAEAGVAALAQVPLAGRHPADLLELTQGLFRLSDRLDAVIQQAMEQIHWTSASWDGANLGPIRWLIEHCRRSPGEAQTRAKVAERIVDTPSSAAAHAEGRVNLAHLKVITTTLAQLPDQDRETAEEILLRAAEHVDPKELARLARQLEEVVDPDRAEAAAKRRYASRYLTVATTFAGMVHVEGMLDPESGAALLAALAPLTAPQGEDDERSAGQRRADALGQLSRDALAGDRLPDINGGRPLVQVTIDWEKLRDSLGLGSIGSPGQDLPLDVATIRRMACDANILPVILGGPSGVLDIGRANKSWPVAIRRAAALRDQGCTFPGCRAPIAFCELHHIWHWIDLGPTSLFNATHLCVRHHQIVHKKGWTVTRHDDGSLTFTDPSDHTTSTWRPPATLTDFMPAARPVNAGTSTSAQRGCNGTGPSDANASCASTFDASTLDAGRFDASTFDASTFDAGRFDAGTLDAGTFDLASADGLSGGTEPLGASRLRRDPFSPSPSGAGPDVACQTGGRHVTTIRIRPRGSTDKTASSLPDAVPRCELDAAITRLGRADGSWPSTDTHAITGVVRSPGALDLRLPRSLRHSGRSLDQTRWRPSYRSARAPPPVPLRCRREPLARNGMPELTSATDAERIQRERELSRVEL